MHRTHYSRRFLLHDMMVVRVGKTVDVDATIATTPSSLTLSQF